MFDWTKAMIPKELLIGRKKSLLENLDAERTEAVPQTG